MLIGLPHEEGQKNLIPRKALLARSGYSTGMWNVEGGGVLEAANCIGLTNVVIPPR